MNILSTIELYGGGPGSGCNPEAGKCGRPSTGGWSFAHGETQKFYQDQNGHYNSDRVAQIHDGAIQKYENKPGQKNPVLKLTAGGTASGKTKVTKIDFQDLRDPAVVNVDMVRSDFPEFPQVVGTDKAGLLQEEASDVRDKVLMAALAHNNDIALDAVGSPTLAQKLDALEGAGYRVSVSYVHSPVDESLMMAANRAKTSKNVADQRKVPEEVTRASHRKARQALPLLARPGREVKVYDRTGKAQGADYDLIYHRTADGQVKVKNSAALEKMRNGEDPKVPDIFQ
jgi:hypothetical protein